MIMTQEDKELLLQDLCARLPYGVICYNSNTESNFKLCDVADLDSGYPTFDYGYGELETVKPYLRPMSSMTEEECIELDNIEATIEDVSKVIPNIPYHIEVVSSKQIDWLNAHHFDHRNLIERGLAIAVTEENDPYKE